MPLKGPCRKHGVTRARTSPRSGIRRCGAGIGRRRRLRRSGRGRKGVIDLY
ncbi:hypothetical protein N177_0382 [Lutibaculum baratangense AMV1]|uniref:Uncharacterized protein n=1 Tax=Lutibaculum baratangense AMV1 TaxID=631454 RepID=V4RLR0_9HYPH|nr:hypothetical protein N177_0382 [Lutibaculum baratangense AMV1]